MSRCSGITKVPVWLLFSQMGLLVKGIQTRRVQYKVYFFGKGLNSSRSLCRLLHEFFFNDNYWF